MTVESVITKRSTFFQQNLPVLIIFALILLFGLLTFENYGESWDENLLQIYAEQSIKSHSTWMEKGEVEFEHENLRHYGPAYVIFVYVSTGILDQLLNLPATDLRHLVYFLTYFAGLIAFHSLARRWLDPLSSAGTTLFFATQPLFWGHAFINPKDTPFLSLFLLSVAAGFKMVDAIQRLSLEEFHQSIGRKTIIISLFWLLSIILFFASTEVIHNIIIALVMSAKAGETNIISFIATKLNEAPAGAYIRRYFTLFMQARAFYFLVSTTALLYYWRRHQPVLLKLLLIILIPAILLGLTTSTRVLGPFAGLIVAYYLLRTSGKSSIPALIMYAFIAITAAYLTWPYLWLDPVGHFWESFTTMSSYPWQGDVLFNGAKFPSTALPLSYLPLLFSIQLTEPVWILALAGLYLSLFGSAKKTGLPILFLLWFLFPVAILMLRGASLYDNFRQILFIFPPVFLMVGVLFERITKPAWRTVVIAVCLLPSLFGVVSLYPYEYTYYNQFIGGIHGASGRFETDYWLTSYREAAEYINENASPSAGVWVEGPGNVFFPFSRPDLNVNSWSSYQPLSGYEYVVASSRFMDNETAQPDAVIVHRIMRGDAVLAVIRKP